MRSILRSMAVLSASSVVRIGIGVLTAKVWAVLLGPVGVGFYGLLQSLLGLAAIVAGLGLGTGIVRLGAQALGQNDRRRAAALHEVAIRMAWGAGAAAALAFVLLRQPLGSWLLGAPQTAVASTLIGMAICLTVVSGLQTGVLNAHQKLTELARSTVIGGAVGAALNIATIWWLRDRGMVWAVLATALGTWLASYWYLRAAVERPATHHPSRDELRRAARALLSFGVPYVGSSLLGTGVLLVLPILVLRVLGVESVGYYRAAVSISFGYVGFLLVAMSQDYYPRLAAAGHDRRRLEVLVNQQLRVVLLIGGPIVLLAQAGAQVMVPLFYSAAFQPAVPVLAWQLFGNVFRFLAWIFAFVILARSSGGAYFAIEATGGMAVLLASWLGMHIWGLVGAGMGFVVGYATYAAVVWLSVKRQIGVVLTQHNVRLMLLMLGVGTLIQSLPHTMFRSWALPASLTAASLVALSSVVWLYRDVRVSRDAASFVITGQPSAT